jgi:uncharacterized protein YjbJ (UPF0337 family)
LCPRGLALYLLEITTCSRWAAQCFPLPASLLLNEINMAINAQELQGQWNQLQGKVKEKWGQLSNDDLNIQSGNIDQLVGKIQEKTGESREAIEKFLTSLTGKGGEAVSKAAEQVTQFAQNVAPKLKEQYGQFSEGAREKLGQAQDVVRHNPSQSVAVAFGVGIAAGVLVGLSLRSR